MPLRASFPQELGLGAAIGWGLALIAVVPVLLTLNLHGHLRLGAANLGSVLLAAVTLAAVTLAEETIARGYALQRLASAVGPSWAAVLIAVGFSISLILGHIPRHVVGALLDGVLLGLLLAMAYLRTHALWAGWGLHFAYRAVAALLLGLPIAGRTDLPSIADTYMTGRAGLPAEPLGWTPPSSPALFLLGAMLVVYHATRDYAWRYTHREIVGAAYEVVVPPPAAHVAMEQQAAAAPAPLVQILPVTPGGFSVRPGDPVNRSSVFSRPPTCVWRRKSASYSHPNRSGLPGPRSPGRGAGMVLSLRVWAFGAILTAGMLPWTAQAQVFTVGKASATADIATDIEPTHVQLPDGKMNERTRLDLVRNLVGEEGFAHRVLPISPDLTLQANGGLKPGAEEYKDLIYKKGAAAAPGDRVAITALEVKGDRLIIDFNGGPYLKHRFLRHVSIGGAMPASADGEQATGSRVTLLFEGGVPDVSAPEVKALLKPLVDFGAKTGEVAYADTLPTPVKSAIASHEVLVGMNHRMVLAALGAPESKVREEADGKRYEEWIYGRQPQTMRFVRFTGDRVSLVKVAEMGKPIEIHDKDELEGYLPPAPRREIAMGDVKPAPDKAGRTADAAAPGRKSRGGG